MQNLIKFSKKINHREGMFVSALCELIKNYKNCKKDVHQAQNDADLNKQDQPIIGVIKEVLRSS
jgi:hypothetical protein